MNYEACLFRANSTSVTLCDEVTQAHPARTGRGLTKLQTGCQFADFTSNGPSSLTDMLTTCRLLLGLGSILMLVGQTHSGFWRKSRRGCSPRNCAWSKWSEWGECDNQCGNAGLKGRSRRKQREAQCGGKGCSDGPTEFQACNRFCHNGGTPQPGYCTCPDVFWGTCCKNRKYYVSVGTVNVSLLKNYICIAVPSVLHTRSSFVF